MLSNCKADNHGVNRIRPRSVTHAIELFGNKLRHDPLSDNVVVPEVADVCCLQSLRYALFGGIRVVEEFDAAVVLSGLFWLSVSGLAMTPPLLGSRTLQPLLTCHRSSCFRVYTSDLKTINAKIRLGN